MKRTWMSLMTLAFAASLAACSGGSAAETTQGAAETGTPMDSQSLGAASTISQMAAGTLKLEGTDLAVTAEQAARLLPLWQAYRALAQSDTTASAELEAVTNQIRESMTSEQLKAIEALGLSQEDLAALIEELGLRPALEAGATPGAGYGPGMGMGMGQGFAGSVPPGGVAGAGPGAAGSAPGFVPGMGMELNPNATPQAGRAGRLGGERLTLMFIEQLLTRLEARAGGA